MLRQSIRTLARPAVVQRSAALYASKGLHLPQAASAPCSIRAISSTPRRMAAPGQDGLDQEKLRKLRKIDEYILGSANDLTAEMATALMGTPEQAKAAKANLAQYSDKVTRELADALGCKPEDIERISQDFDKSANVLQDDLEKALRGDKGAMDKLAQDLNQAADKVGSQTLRLIGFSEGDIRAARDQFAAATEQIRQQVKDAAKQGKGAVRDEVEAEDALAKAMARFSRDFRRGAGQHRLNKDAEKVGRALRLALDPVAREEVKHQRNNLLYLIAAAALIAGGIYGYKASQPAPDLVQDRKILDHIDSALDGPPKEPTSGQVRDSKILAHIDNALDGPPKEPTSTQAKDKSILDHIDNALNGPPKKPQ